LIGTSIWIGDADDGAIVNESATSNGDDEANDFGSCARVFYEGRHCVADDEEIENGFVYDGLEIGFAFVFCRNHDANVLAKDSDFCFGDEETASLLPPLTLSPCPPNHHQEGFSLVQVDWNSQAHFSSECEAK